MYSEVVDRVTIRPLRNGETAIVQAVFDRLGDRSRHLRFGGAKMAKSVGNISRVVDLLEAGVNARALRYALISEIGRASCRERVFAVV